MVKSIDIILNSSIIISFRPKIVAVKDHAVLEHLDYEHSGHTGFASSEQLNEVNNSAVHKTGDERVSGTKTFVGPINFDALIFTSNGEFRFADHVYFTDNSNEHKRVLEIYANDIIAQKTFTAKGAVNVDGLIYAGGNELRFKDHLNITDNTDAHNVIFHIFRDYINAERIVTLKRGANIDVQPTEAQHATRKDYVDNAIQTLFRNQKIKVELIPDEYDEVIEFEKQVSGAAFMDQTLATAHGTIVWCAATKAICGDTYYRKFLINTNGTQAGVRTFDPADGKLYVGKTDSNIFRWSGSNLLEVSKSINLGETASTAYAGNKGKANAEAIAALQSKQLKVVGFYDSADQTLNRLSFPKSQTQMIFFGYKYNSNDPIKGGSVPLFNDNIMELAPNTADNEYFRVKADTNGDNTVLTIYQNLMSYVRFLVIETNVSLLGE